MKGDTLFIHGTLVLFAQGSKRAARCPGRVAMDTGHRLVRRVLPGQPIVQVNR